ncbi:hypothetical protein QJ850_gp358 [Acanthamoeba polyphaga mimivirus]|uniref:Uncharacterized protein n=1 Tax=Acanthamoeba polyphaga mimivirus Kroon TaxID=3069720 RepID=A0A0G2YB82_9VIRU|nr:hypothetical protein QJ850_gp358 [Acanthamoeba polyphaga mimivirus]AKI80341.1 hypothetical protein [Acanthamoeba polyphaga mimivirus Kroon]
MSTDKNILLYAIANNFKETLGLKVCKSTKGYISEYAESYSELSNNDKMYYTKYAIAIINCLSKYLEDQFEQKMCMFKMNDEDSEVVHDFRIVCDNEEVIHLSMDYKKIGVNPIIPDRLMKLCGYNKNTNMYKEYTKNYNNICKNIYKKIGSYDKYSELSDKQREKIIYRPMNELLINTIGGKKKCTEKLYEHVFPEGVNANRIVIKWHKNRFIVYDFRTQVDEIKSFKLSPFKSKSKQSEDDARILYLTFKNGSKLEPQFILTLNTNSTDINEHISLKYTIKLDNIDELFKIGGSSIQ